MLNFEVMSYQWFCIRL